jgi:VCBS repeat-containing protein
MLVESHADTGDECKATTALLPQMIGNIHTAARPGLFRRATSTPDQAAVGDPHGRARTGWFGMLWLTALTFSLANKVQAADPGVTFLDDGNITYKDLEHGAFELVTKEAIPRHFLVEDPGQTVVLRSQGSSVSISQSTNSPARMAELQAAQQEALATYEKGLGSTGSSTPPVLDHLPVQPINFIQTDDGPAELELLAPTPSVFPTIPETIFGKLPPPQPVPPTLNALLGPTETDTVVFDHFTATSGIFLASSSNGSPLTFGIDGGTRGNNVIDGATYDVSEVGSYGTLYVNSTSGAYTFVPNSDAINALVAPTTTDFVITVSDGTLSAEQTFTIAIDGTNDAAIISGVISGTAAETGATAGSTLSAPSVTGTLTDTDVDNTPNTFREVDTPTASAKGFGTFTMAANGVWAYTLDQGNSAVQALNVGDKLTDSFTVTTLDGTPQVVTITINGANDAAIIAGATTGSVTEDSGPKCEDPTATGRLTATDVDNPSNLFASVDCPTASDHGYGTFTMTADGVWTYKLDDSNCAVQALNDGDTLTDTFTVTSIDGTEQVVTITIHGANDADPNDFDHLATGRHVVSDPPYIFGTRGDDNIDRCDHYGRIIFTGAGDDTISATGKCDLIYAGSGNDLVKGNDGDDTIYGGSGRDTIYGGDGCDTIVGGYGADHLSGGKGNDSFVFLSTADSNAARFDVITDFKSGSDRIDLTALGALSLLALTSTSTSVPAHTIAWFYDSATNQTILYVNSTDQTHDIGDSALLEIHLEGLVTVQASDFVPEPNEAPVVVAAEHVSAELAVTADTDAAASTVAADASPDGVHADDAHVHGGSWTLRAAWNGDSFDVSRQDETRAQPAESTNDDGHITLASGPSVDVHHTHATSPTNNGLAPDQISTHDTVVHNASVTALNDDRGTSQRIEQHNDWSFSPAIHSGSQSDDDDPGQRDDPSPSTAKDASNGQAWNDHAHDHHWNSDKYDTSKHGDTFHFKDTISVLDVVHPGHGDQAWAPANFHGNAARSSEPPGFPEPARAASNHQAPDSSKHHWPDSFNSGPDHAWSGAHGHAPHHDLMV